MTTPVKDHINVIKFFCEEFDRIDSLPESNEIVKDMKKEYISMIVGKIEEQILSIKLYI